MTKKDASDLAYGLMLTIGTIQDEMNKGGEPPSLEEIDNLYGLASDLNEWFEDNEYTDCPRSIRDGGDPGLPLLRHAKPIVG